MAAIVASSPARAPARPPGCPSESASGRPARSEGSVPTMAIAPVM